jgi:hypothetical protein
MRHFEEAKLWNALIARRKIIEVFLAAPGEAMSVADCAGFELERTTLCRDLKKLVKEGLLRPGGKSYRINHASDAAALAPFSFADIKRRDYMFGLLAFYERGHQQFLAEAFVEAYGKSAGRYEDLVSNISAGQQAYSFNARIYR